jgi:3-oxoadipate enol-lactonase
MTGQDADAGGASPDAPAQVGGYAPAVHVETRGPEDATPLLCLHGGIGTGAYHWGRAAKTLAERYLVHLPDLPGHGRTPLPDDGRYDRDVLVDAVRLLIDEVGAPAHVLAFSLGGHAGLALAAVEPDRFASLCLVGVSVAEHDGLEGWRKRFDPDALEREQPLWARTLARLHEPLGGSDAWKEVVRRDSGSMRGPLDPTALEALDCPVLLIRGDRDPAVDPVQYAELRALWGDRAEELVVPRGGHDVQMTRHELVEPALTDFLARVTG